MVLIKDSGSSKSSSTIKPGSGRVITTPGSVRRTDYYSPGGGAWNSSQQAALDANGYDTSINGNVATDYLRGIGQTGGTPTYDPGGGGGSGGGGGGYGGGGGGGGGSQVTQALLDQLAGIYKQAKPSDLTANKFSYDDYKGTGFYDFNDSPYREATSGLAKSVADARNRAAGAYGDARTELNQYRNSFAGAGYATDPGVSASMQRMMQAQGMDPTAATGQTQFEGVQADRAMGDVMALLGANANEAQGARQRALAGDERRTNEMISSQQTDLSTAISMAKAQALSAYEKEKWAYGEQIAQQNYQKRMQIAQQNWERQNQVNDANVQSQNQFKQGMLDPITSLAMANPALNMDALLKIIGQ